MAWSGGTYTKGNNVSGGWVGDASVGIGIEAGRHDTQDNDFATGINTCLTKDGQNAATADLPMGGFKHTNVATATARNNYAAVSQVQDGDYIWLGTTAGTATAMTASATPAITAYKVGQKFRMIIGAGLGSTGSVATAATININGIGAKNIVNNEDSTNPTLGTWVAAALMELVYDGTNFRITNEPTGWQTWTPTVTPAAGTASSVVTNARFRKNGKKVEVTFDVNWTQGVASTLYVTVSMPVNLDGLNQTVPAMVIPQGTSFASVAFAHSTSAFRFYTYDATTQFFTGASRNIWGNFYYRSV